MTPRERALALQAAVKERIKDLYTATKTKIAAVWDDPATHESINHTVETLNTVANDATKATSTGIKSAAHYLWGFTDNPTPSPVLQAARQRAIDANTPTYWQQVSDYTTQTFSNANEYLNKLTSDTSEYISATTDKISHKVTTASTHLSDAWNSIIKD